MEFNAALEQCWPVYDTIHQASSVRMQHTADLAGTYVIQRLTAW